MDEDKKADPFHDGDVDIYDLFIACDGAVRDDGLLDVGRLNRFSAAQAEALNVPRLMEVWLHTEKTRCPECALIVRTLNMIRGTLGEGAEESSDECAQAAGVQAPDYTQ